MACLRPSALTPGEETVRLLMSMELRCDTLRRAVDEVGRDGGDFVNEKLEFVEELRRTLDFQGKLADGLESSIPATPILSSLLERFRANIREQESRLAPLLLVYGITRW